MQNEVIIGKIKFWKIDGKQNPTDIGTKYLSIVDMAGKTRSGRDTFRKGRCKSERTWGLG